MQNKTKFLNLILMLLVIIPFGVLAVAENSLNMPLLDGSYIEDLIGDPQYEFIHNWDSFYSDYDSIDIRFKNDPGISATHYEGGTPAPAYISLAGTYFYLDDSDDGYGIKMDILPGDFEINEPIEFRAGDPDDVTHTQWRDFTYDLSTVPNILSQKKAFEDSNVYVGNQVLYSLPSYYTLAYRDSEIDITIPGEDSILNYVSNDHTAGYSEIIITSSAANVRLVRGSSDTSLIITPYDGTIETLEITINVDDGAGISITDTLTVFLNQEIGGSTDLLDGLLHYYDFDSDATDSIGNHNGIVYGAVQTPVKINNGYLFDSINDYIDLETNLDLNSLPISVSFHYRRPDLISAETFVSGITINYHGFWFQIDGSGIFYCNYGDGTGTSTDDRKSFSSSSTVITDLNLHHIVVKMIDFNTCELYVDNVLYPLSYHSGGATSINLVDARYEVMKTGSSNYAGGELDELGFFNINLETAKIDSLYNDGAGYNPVIPEIGNVFGTIYSVDQNTQYDVLQGETIILTNAAGDEVLQTVVTTISGLYTFDLPFGTYDLYHDQVAPVNIIEDNIIIAGTVAGSDYFIDILTPEQISSQSSFSLTNGNTFNLPMNTIFDYASEMEVTFTADGVTTTIDEGVIQCFSFGCMEINTNVLYVTTAGTGIISDIILTGINYYGATDLNEYRTDSTPPFEITVTDAILDPPILVVPIPDFTVSLAEVKTFLVSDYFTNWDNVTLGFQDDIAEQSVLLTSGKGLATDTYNVNHVTVTLTPLVDDVRVTITAKLASGFTTNIDLKVFNDDGLDNDVFSYTIVNLVTENPFIKEQIYDFNSVVGESYLFPMNDYFYNSDNIKVSFTIGTSVYTLNEDESIETELADFTIVFNTFVFNPKAIGVVTNIIFSGINNNGEVSMLPFETTINYPIQIPGIKKQIESSTIGFNTERIYNINDYFEFYDNFYASFYFNNTVYNLMGDTVLDLNFATITLDQADKTLIIDSTETSGKLNDITITAINVHGTNTLNPFTVEVQTGGELLTTILGSGVIFPDSTTLSSTQKWTYASLTILAVLLGIMILGFFIIRSVDISPVLVIVTSIIGAVATFFYFIAIKYIPVGVLIVIVLISGAIIFLKAR